MAGKNKNALIVVIIIAAALLFLSSSQKEQTLYSFMSDDGELLVLEVTEGGTAPDREALFVNPAVAKPGEILTIGVGPEIASGKLGQGPCPQSGEAEQIVEITEDATANTVIKRWTGIVAVSECVSNTFRYTYTAPSKAGGYKIRYWLYKAGTNRQNLLVVEGGVPFRVAEAVSETCGLSTNVGEWIFQGDTVDGNGRIEHRQTITYGSPPECKPSSTFQTRTICNSGYVIKDKTIRQDYGTLRCELPGQELFNIGESCILSEDCKSGLTCWSNKCSAGEVGNSCLPSVEVSCNVGLFCNSETRTCTTTREPSGGTPEDLCASRIPGTSGCLVCAEGAVRKNGVCVSADNDGPSTCTGSSCGVTGGSNVPFSDALVIKADSIEVPETVKAGQTVEIEFEVQNTGSEKAQVNVEAVIYSVKKVGTQAVYASTTKISTCGGESFADAANVVLSSKGTALGGDDIEVKLTPKAPSEESTFNDANKTSNWAGYGTNYKIVLNTYDKCSKDGGKIFDTKSFILTITDDSGIVPAPSLKGGLDAVETVGLNTLLKSLCLDDSNCQSGLCVSNDKVAKRLDDSISETKSSSSSIGAIINSIGPGGFGKVITVKGSKVVESVCVEPGEEGVGIIKLFKDFAKSISGAFGVSESTGNLLLAVVLLFVLYKFANGRPRRLKWELSKE